MPAVASSDGVSPLSPPSRPGHFLLGVSPEFQREPLDAFIRAIQEQGDVVKLRFGPYVNYLVAHPDAIQYVIQTNYRNYRRAAFGNDILKFVAGLNLVTSDGDYWLRQRRLMQPAFHRKRIAGFGKIITDATLAMLTQWTEQADKAQPIDITKAVTRLTMRIVGLALFSVDLTAEAQMLGQGFRAMNSYIEYRLNAFWTPPLFIPTRQNRTIKQTIRTLNQVLQKMIDDRRRQNIEHHDLMAMFLEMRDEETGQGMTDEQIRNELIAMIGAGYETVAAALPWTFYRLCQNPEIEAQLLDELTATLRGRVPTIDDLPDLSSVRMVFEETLRLHPPFWSLTPREAIEDDTIGGYHIPAGSVVLIVPYALHRDPRFWDNPERFDPSRFSPERCTERHRFAFLPFGMGPRKCIGDIFALTEAQLILATILPRYQLRLKPGYQVKPDASFILRVKNGLPMTISAR